MARNERRGDEALGNTAPSDSLKQALRQVADRFHPHLESLSIDTSLFETVLRLYDKPEGRVWSEQVRPFLEENQERLRGLYGEQELLPVPLLDDPVAILILERLENDVVRLERVWPYEPSLLDALASAWGANIQIGVPGF
jgi:hypothetical protein